MSSSSAAADLLGRDRDVPPGRLDLDDPFVDDEFDLLVAAAGDEELAEVLARDRHVAVEHRDPALAGGRGRRGRLGGEPVAGDAEDVAGRGRAGEAESTAPSAGRRSPSVMPVPSVELALIRAGLIPRRAMTARELEGKMEKWVIPA